MRFLLIALMMLSFISCGSDTDNSNDSDSVDADVTIVDEAVDDLSDEDSESETVDEDTVYTPVVTDRVLVTTNMGNITIGLYADELPKTTANFKQYVTDKFYDGLIFHRIVPTFVIQAGGFDKDLVARETRDAINFEENTRVKHVKYAVSMARSTMHSATSQFFITLDAHPHLDYTSYDDFLDENKFPCVAFGVVIEGFDTVDKIAGVETETVDAFEGVPTTPIIIESAVLIN